jgi:ribosomal protein S12 methylthiotransferase accessory factor YcaO
MRHAGLMVQNMDREIDWFQRLGYKVKIHRVEEWAHRRLEIVKMERDYDQTMVELIHPITGEWSPHISIDVDSWPQSPVVVKHLGEPMDETLEVGFAISPNGNVVELVKRKA